MSGQYAIAITRTSEPEAHAVAAPAEFCDSIVIEFVALVHRMRVLQKLLDQTPGASLGFRHEVEYAEADVDAECLRLYLPEAEPTPLEGGKP